MSIHITKHKFTFKKKEHLCKQKQITELFVHKTGAITLYPLRIIFRYYHSTLNNDVPTQVLLSVSKKHFKHAVDRNKIKRQLREGYRKQKEILQPQSIKDRHLDIAFVWIAPIQQTTLEVETLVQKALKTIKESAPND